MALLRPMYMQPASGDPAIQYSAKDDRAGLLSSIFSREGVIDPDGGSLLVTQRAAGANYTVDIAPGRAAIQGDDVSDQGMYLVTSTTTVNLATPAKPGSGTRIHRLVARVRDKLHNGVWTGYDWVFEILQDTGSGTPATPNSAISIATITMTSSMSSVTNANITDTRPWARAGTKDQVGSWDLPTELWNWDNNRRGRYQVNANGWVSLSGWYTRKSNFTYNANQQYQEVVLPEAIRPSAVRDFIGLSSNNFVHWAVNPAGELRQRYYQGATLTAGVTWISFDGCGYLL